MTGLNHRFDENVYDRNANFHPGSVFDHPRDVLADAALPRAEKRAILAMRRPVCRRLITKISLISIRGRYIDPLSPPVRR